MSTAEVAIRQASSSSSLAIRLMKLILKKLLYLSGIWLAVVLVSFQPTALTFDVQKIIGTILVASVLFATFFGSPIAPRDPYLKSGLRFSEGPEGTVFTSPPFAPSAEFPLGSDHLGRDILPNLICCSFGTGYGSGGFLSAPDPGRSSRAAGRLVPRGSRDHYSPIRGRFWGGAKSLAGLRRAQGTIRPRHCRSPRQHAHSD